MGEGFVEAYVGLDILGYEEMHSASSWGMTEVL